jgi:hypothetical protein
MVVGDRLPYLSCFVTLKENLDETVCAFVNFPRHRLIFRLLCCFLLSPSSQGAPTGALSDTALFHLKSIGSSARTVAEVR